MEQRIPSYQVGPLLYCPANRDGLAASLASEHFGQSYSLALCLEDTICDDKVEEAEHLLKNTLHTILTEKQQKSFFLPKIFIRVRTPEQIPHLGNFLGHAFSLVTGFILPKYDLSNSHDYLKEISNINLTSDKTIYMMPILESPSLIPLHTRYQLLSTLKAELDSAREYVLNIRVGGNDLCNAFGFRRHNNETIYQISPVCQILSDIMTTFGQDYVVSGPVWEYYNGNGWDSGLKCELEMDRLNGFLGKTVIHPNQISLVNDSLRVSKEDFEDACSILEWNSSDSFVSKSVEARRMNEYKTHRNWALKTKILADLYGIKK